IYGIITARLIYRDRSQTSIGFHLFHGGLIQPESQRNHYDDGGDADGHPQNSQNRTDLPPQKAAAAQSEQIQKFHKFIPVPIISNLFIVSQSVQEIVLLFQSRRLFLLL